MDICEIIVKEGRRAINADKVAELAASIQELGLLSPIIVNSNGELIAGAHRLEACKQLGWDDIPATAL